MSKTTFEDFAIKICDTDIYQRENLILSKVNIEIRKGEFVYLVGQVGSGKSSLLKLLYGELEWIQGEGHIAGFDLKKIKDSKLPFLRRKLGIIFQDFQLLQDRSVRKNLEFVLKATGWKKDRDIRKRIKEVLERVAMFEYIDKMPFQLSGGEQQRIGIARALLNDPDIILADEPTGNLDPENSEYILSIFNEINAQGKTIVMATHDYLLIDKCPQRTLVCRSQKVDEKKESGESIDFDEFLS